MENRLTRLPALLLLSVVVFALAATPTFAASAKEVVRDFYFEADSADDLSYPAEKEIEIDGKHYRVKDISYNLYSDPISEKKTVKSKNKQADGYITKTIEGTEFKLYAPAEIKWKDNDVTYTEEYATESEVPNQIEYEGQTLSLRSVEPASRKDTLSTTAKFYSSYPDTDTYMFNGKEVTLKDGPTWSGYKDDYAEYFGIDNDNRYSITGSKWKGKAKKTGDGYVRYATVYGTKVVNYYQAVFGLGDDDSRYTADITYTSKYIGHAKVTYERYFTMMQKLVYAGVGLAIVALLTTLILFFLKRRREEDKEESAAA